MSVQALFRDPNPRDSVEPEVDSVYVSLGPAGATGSTLAEALTVLARGRGGDRLLAGDDTTLTLEARWARARSLMARADSALRAGDFETFARLFEELRQALGAGASRRLARPQGPR